MSKQKGCHSHAFFFSLSPPSIYSTTNIKSIANDLYKECSLKRLFQKFKKSSELKRFRIKTNIYKLTSKLVWRNFLQPIIQ